MLRLVRPLAAFGVATVTSLVAFHFAGGTSVAEVLPKDSRMASFGDFSIGGGYELEELELVERALYYVEESYVEPGRIDFEKMYVHALEAVERQVPVAMFRRDAELLHVELGRYRTIVEVPEIASRKQLHRELQRVATLVQQNLEPSDIPTEDDDDDPYAAIEYTLINGLLSTLDPHSVLLPPEDSMEMDVENQGEFGGLGITIVERKGRLTVEYPLEGTPAKEAGLQADDQIVRIEGESTINMSLEEAVSRLRGPVGSRVTIEIMRDGYAEPKPVSIVRQIIKINAVKGELLDGGVGYVSISTFHANVGRDLQDLLTRLHREAGQGGLRGVVLDLRGNPGGFLNQAVQVSDTFLEQGTIVSTVDGSNRKNDQQVARPGNTQPRYPIAILVNANSASASEIVSGALRNNDRAVVIGERTFGKGSVQNLHDNRDMSKLKLTIAKYLTPGDRSIQSVGIPSDIELVPAILGRSEDEGEEQVWALYHWRERVRREADLDKHLEQSSHRIEEPVYSVRYHQPPPNKQKKRSDALDLHDDYEVKFARDLLLAAPASAWRRPDVLAAASQVVSRHQRQESRQIEQAFAALDVDWRDGRSAQAAELDVRFDLGEDGKLIAGTEEVIALEVTNNGEQPLYRLSAVAEFDNEFLETREFFFGHVPPGETRRFEQRVKIGEGYPSELTPVTFTFRDSGNSELAVEHGRLPVEGRGLPRLAWSWTMSDAAPHGDGDGVLEVGEDVVMALAVENLGEGPTGEAFARVRNKSRKAIDIVKGTLEIGSMLTADGEACAVIEAGIENGEIVGDPATGVERIASEQRPRYADGCRRQLPAGASWTGELVITLNDGTDAFRELELTLGDTAAYDHASIVRAGFYEYFTNEERIRLEVGKPAPKVTRRVPPEIRITRSPEQVVETERATLSGVVTDDSGVAHVLVFAKDDKVFFQGSDPDDHIQSVPFTADVALQSGLNTITVLATDEQGFTSTRSAITLFLGAEQQAQLGIAEPKGKAKVP